MIKFVSDFRPVGGTPVSSTNKTDRHDVTEILLKVGLNTITLTITPQTENQCASSNSRKFYVSNKREKYIIVHNFTSDQIKNGSRKFQKKEFRETSG